MNSLLIKLTTILGSHLGVERHEVKPEAKLMEDLGADSLDCVEITMAIEEEWAPLVISDEESEKFITVQDIISFLEEKGLE